MYCPFCGKEVRVGVFNITAQMVAIRNVSVECACGGKLDVGYFKDKDKVFLTIQGASAECFADKPTVVAG